MVFARRCGYEAHRLYAWDSIPSKNASLLIKWPLKNYCGVGEVGAHAEPTAAHEPSNLIED